MKGITFDNPCPKCGKPSSPMAGINVPGGDISRTYLVCWKDGVMKDARKGGDWIRMKGAVSVKSAWTKHTPFHWSRDLNGKRLDYWPSKRKWQYDGRISRGDINGFLRRREGG